MNRDTSNTGTKVFALCSNLLAPVYTPTSDSMKFLSIPPWVLRITNIIPYSHNITLNAWRFQLHLLKAFHLFNFRQSVYRFLKWYGYSVNKQIFDEGLSRARLLWMALPDHLSQTRRDSGGIRFRLEIKTKCFIWECKTLGWTQGQSTTCPQAADYGANERDGLLDLIEASKPRILGRWETVWNTRTQEQK